MAGPFALEVLDFFFLFSLRTLIERHFRSHGLWLRGVSLRRWAGSWMDVRKFQCDFGISSWLAGATVKFCCGFILAPFGGGFIPHKFRTPWMCNVCVFL